MGPLATEILGPLPLHTAVQSVCCPRLLRHRPRLCCASNRHAADGRTTGATAGASDWRRLAQDGVFLPKRFVHCENPSDGLRSTSLGFRGVPLQAAAGLSHPPASVHP